MLSRIGYDRRQFSHFLVFPMPINPVVPYCDYSQAGVTQNRGTHSSVDLAIV